MFSEASCSDCKLEFIHRNWSKLLIKWINRCVYKNDQNPRVRRLSMKCLSDIMTKYKKDVCDDDMDRAMLCTDDMEPFIKYKYPILRLRFLTEDTDQPKKLYIMTSILLYHCCVKSRSGVVHDDIFQHLRKHEQELVVKFCERLKEMETTINNVEVAVQDAFEAVFKEDDVPSNEPSLNFDAPKSSDTVAQMSSTSTIKSSLTSLPSDPTMIEQNRVPALKIPPSKFTSSITVLPSVVTDTSNYSNMIEDSDDDDKGVAEKVVYVDSDDINFYTRDKSLREYNIEDDFHRDKNIERVQKQKDEKSEKDIYVNSDEINFYTQDIPTRESKRKDNYQRNEKERIIQRVQKKNYKKSEKDVYVNSDEIDFYTQEISIRESKREDYHQRDERERNVQRMQKEKDETSEKDVYVDSDEINFYTQDILPNRDSKKEDYNRDEIVKNVQRVQKEYDSLRPKEEQVVSGQPNLEEKYENITQNDFQTTYSKNPRCLPDCSCNEFSDAGPCCGDPGVTISALVDAKLSEHDDLKLARLRFNRKLTALLVSILLCVISVAVLSIIVPLFFKAKKPQKNVVRSQRLVEQWPNNDILWKCINNLCQKMYKMQSNDENIYYSHSECTLKCTGPQIWPLPIGDTKYSKKIINLATNKLEYKLKTVPSDNVHRHLAEAFKLFIADLAKLEQTGRKKRSDVQIKKMNIKIDVESDPDPRLRLNTEEAYQLKLETTKNEVVIQISSLSFCGVRHGLETLTQMILLDESNGHLITVSNADIKDAPSFKYRGLMIDTGRNYIPVNDLMRTVDAMATVKLNTFHWRISDATSFPLYLPKLPQLFEYGAYDRSMIYSKEDVKTVVKRAGVRGIRVLMEIAAPGPVGRPWSWSPSTSCPSKNNNTCDNILCLKLDNNDSVLNVLQVLYEDILEMTQVDDIFHLSNGLFSLSKCFNTYNNQYGFLDKALDRLKLANKGFLPKLPVIWYTSQLSNDFESKTWERFGVQLHEWNPNPTDNFLSKFKVIHSSKWELSCEMKKQRCKKYRNWQEMYSWKSWRNVRAFTVEGGEALLWTDLVDSGNLDYTLWPRAAAVAERLWSDIVANTSADGSIYVRLNTHRFVSQKKA